MIRTSRLLLRPFTLADVPKLFAMSREAGMQRWIPDQVYRDERHAEQVITALMTLTSKTPDPRKDPYVLGIEAIEARTLVGHVGLSPARGSVEIGYSIEDRVQGQGLATEAVRAMTTWGLHRLSLPEVLGIVAADNVSSCRVLEKAGFVRCGEDGGVRVIYRCSASSEES